MQALTKLAVLGCLAWGLGGCESEYALEDDVPTPELSKEVRVERFEERSDDHVGYHNPKTGYSSDYTLDVEQGSDGEVERINFPNGGYEDDFVSQRDNGDGSVTVEDEDGREFTVERD